jgi:hypothetical protein
MSLRSVVAVCLLTVACGKSGPPLPPLVKLPAAPANIVAERRGTAVDVEFTVPVANTDGTRPANVERVDVYAITGPETMTDEQIIKHGVKVATVSVKAPRDPDQAAEPDDPDAVVDPPEGAGLDQGTLAHVAEQLTGEALVPFDPSTDKSARKTNGDREPVVEVPRPLMGPLTVPASRTYVGVGISTRGKKGPVSKRVLVPLVPPPPPPGAPKVSYDEKTITVEWQPVVNGAAPAEPADDDVLPSTPIGQYAPAIAYQVYDVAQPAADSSSAAQAPTPPAASTQPPGTFVKLTKAPVTETTFADARITWGEKRCYAVRTIETLGGLTIESDASPVECATLADTFPPAAPANLQAVASEGAISLIWDASAESDLAGYLVFRGASGGTLEAITPAPIPDPRFHDEVKSGVSFAYAVKAVDKAGNISAESNRVEETARD